MRGGSLALLLFTASLGEAAAQAKVDRIEIVETGLYVAETALIEHAPLTATGQRNILSKTTLLKPATRIEAKVGVHFGMRYRVVGAPNNATVKLTSVTRYPVPGLKKPGTPTVQDRGEHS